jgi:hypothetical protein
MNADIIDVTPMGQDLDEELGTAGVGDFSELEEMEDAQFAELDGDEG